jgi:hypothetical protein
MRRPNIRTSLFDNFAGIAQVVGRIGASRWMFHARGGDWQFHVVEVEGRHPDCAGPEPADYWEQGRYPPDRHLTNDEVSGLAFACVGRYWECRGRRAPFS